MDLRKVARAVLPTAAVAHLRRAKWQRERRRIASLDPLGEAGVARILIDDLGLQGGDLPYLHSVIHGLNLASPCYRIRSSMQEAIGSGGTVMFPSSPHDRLS